MIWFSVCIIQCIFGECRKYWEYIARQLWWFHEMKLLWETGQLLFSKNTKVKLLSHCNFYFDNMKGSNIQTICIEYKALHMPAVQYTLLCLLSHIHYVMHAVTFAELYTVKGIYNEYSNCTSSLILLIVLKTVATHRNEKKKTKVVVATGISRFL